MKHDNAHRLDVACLDCVKKHIEHKEKLLDFIKRYSECFPCECEYCINNKCPTCQCKELLKSIEADND